MYPICYLYLANTKLTSWFHPPEVAGLSNPFNYKYFLLLTSVNSMKTFRKNYIFLNLKFQAEKVFLFLFVPSFQILFGKRQYLKPNYIMQNILAYLVFLVMLQYHLRETLLVMKLELLPYFMVITKNMKRLSHTKGVPSPGIWIGAQCHS